MKIMADKTGESIRPLALRLLQSYENEGRYVNLLLNTPEVKRLTDRARAQLTGLLYTTVENKLKYDYFIGVIAKRPLSELESRVRDILRLGMCQLLDMDKIPDFAVINETVALADNAGTRGFVNAVLRRIAEMRDCLPYPDRKKDELRYLSVRYSFPKPMVKLLHNILGNDTEALLQAFSAKAPLSITVNPRASLTRDELAIQLSEHSPTPSRYSNHGLTLLDNAVPSGLAGFSEGSFFVQDEASRVAIEALGVKAGDRVIDVCAAPGGKSFLAGALACPGECLSLDLHESKLSLIRDGAKRLGLTNISVDCCDATMPRTELFGSFDALICDVPCSGLGVLGKKPDIRYRDVDSISHLPSIQHKILVESVKYLKPGGVLVYSTCTINPDENKAVTDKFLAENSGCKYMDFTVGELSSCNGCLTLYPHIHGTDGFFIAKIIKS